MTDHLPYHSATHFHSVEEAEPLDRWVSADGKREAFAHDFADTLVLPSEFDRCDVLYAEPPWPHGWKVFYDRADIEMKVPYNVFLNACSRALKDSGKPGLMICAMDYRVQLMCAPPTFTTQSAVLTPSRPCALLWYNVEPPKLQLRTNTDVIRWLAQEYECVGDFTSGYGYTGRLFSEAGKSWVLSDLDPRCIGYIAANAESWS